MAEKDTEVDAEVDAEAEGGKKKSPLILIIIIAVVCAGGGGAYFMFAGGSAEDAEVAAGDGTEGDGEAVAESKEAFYFSLDPAFVVNFQGPSKGKGRAGFLQVNIDGMTRVEQTKLEVTKHLPQIRNNIVLLLSSKTYDDLITPEGKESLRKEVLSEIQKVMESETGQAESVENIFFTSFVMQ